MNNLAINFIKQFIQTGGPFCLHFAAPNDAAVDDDAPQPDADDTPVVAPTGLTEDEVDRRVEAARQEEKAKLYEQISTLQKQVGDLKESATASTNQTAELTTQLTEAQLNYQNLLDSQTKTKDGKKSEVDIEKLVKKTTDTATTTLTQQYDKRLSAMQEQLDQANAKAHQLEISRYRDSKIGSANNQIVPELVTGTTVEEIDRTFDIALKTYQNIVAQVGTPAGNPPATPPPSSPPMPPTQPIDPVSTSAVQDNVPSPRRFGRVGMKEYANTREKLMADLQKRYQRKNTIPVQM